MDEDQGANMVRNLHLTALLMLGAAWCGCAAELPAKPSMSGEQVISTGQFKLVSEPERFVLHVSLPERQEQIVIPRDWLVPQEEEKEEEAKADEDSEESDEERIGEDEGSPE